MFIQFITTSEEPHLTGLISDLIDSDFVEHNIRRWADAIDVYEKRNLNVAANLVLMFLWRKKMYGSEIEPTIEWNKKHTAKYSKYANDIEKYLMLV